MPDTTLRPGTADDVVVTAPDGYTVALKNYNAAKDKARLTFTRKVDPPPVDPPPPSGAFMSYPLSPNLEFNGINDMVIERKSFKATQAGKSAIVLNGCKRITIRFVDFLDVPGCIYAVDCESIVIEDARYQNITGPHQRVGNNVGNFVQFNGVSGGAVRRVKGKGGDTEDIISVYQTHDMLIEDCHFEGTNWSSTSGSGIMLGDSGGSGNIARRNTLVNVGQVGIGIAGGMNCKAEGNILIGEQRPQANIALYVANYGGGSCGGHTVNGNRYNWLNAAGQQNGYWTSGECGPVAGSNQQDASLKAADYRVVL